MFVYLFVCLLVYPCRNGEDIAGEGVRCPPGRGTGYQTGCDVP